MTETANELKVLDADAGIGDIGKFRKLPPVAINIGGKRYEAFCPKMVWFRELAKLRNDELDAREQLAAMEVFLEHCFSKAVSKSLRDRLNDDKDVLDVVPHLTNAALLLAEHFEPVIVQYFDAMNVENETPARSAAPRKGTAKKQARKA